MTYHMFPRFVNVWPGVLPGDLVVSPKANAYSYATFETRNVDTKSYTLGKSPLLVMAVLHMDKSPTIYDDEVLYVVMSRHGLLCIVMQKK